MELSPLSKALSHASSQDSTEECWVLNPILNPFHQTIDITSLLDVDKVCMLPFFSDLPTEFKNVEAIPTTQDSDLFDEEELIILYQGDTVGTLACHYASAGLFYRNPSLFFLDTGDTNDSRNKKCSEETKRRYIKVAEHVAGLSGSRSNIVYRFDDFKLNCLKTTHNFSRSPVLDTFLQASVAVDLIASGQVPITIWTTEPVDPRKLYDMSYCLSQYHRRPITVMRPFSCPTHTVLEWARDVCSTYPYDEKASIFTGHKPYITYLLGGCHDVRYPTG
jgi:hypothetical protein